MASKYEKQADKYINPLENEELAKNKKLWQQKAQDARKYYDNQIFEAGRAYEDQYRDNAVQKAINERQVAESIANLGLTDSGLDRTQQTAVILSAANNRAAIDRARQQKIDNIELEKTGDLSTIRQGYLSDQATIRQNYDKLKTEYASKLYDTEVNALLGGDAGGTPKIISNNNTLLSRNYVGTLSDNGISVTTWIDNTGTEYTKYTDYNTGKSSTFLSSQNPYTGSVNYDVEKGAFESTKYQPKYVSVDEYGQWPSNKNDAVETLELKEYSSTFIPKLGKSQKVFDTKDRNGKVQYWMWDGALNQYFEVVKNENTGEWDLKQ